MAQSIGNSLAFGISSDHWIILFAINASKHKKKQNNPHVLSTNNVVHAGTSYLYVFTQVA